VQSKTCTGCKQDKLLDEYHASREGKFGRKSRCKDCCRPINKASKDRRREAIKVYNAEYRARNKAKASAATKKWVQENYYHVLSYNARRRSKMSKATLPGYGEELSHYYKESRRLSLAGEAHHVDHIVPLNGDGVCGLHVPWNLQVLPATVNMSKGNSFDQVKEDI
jgi:hypothetical protein